MAKASQRASVQDTYLKGTKAGSANTHEIMLRVYVPLLPGEKTSGRDESLMTRQHASKKWPMPIQDWSLTVP